MGCSQYLIQILRFKQLQERLIDNSLQLKNEEKLKIMQLFSNQFVKQYKDILIQSSSGLNYMFQNKKQNELNMVYKILKQHANFDYLKKQFYNFLRSKGFQLFLNLKKQNLSHQVVNKFSLFYQQYFQFTSVSFDNSTQFLVQFRNAMETVINLNQQQFHISQLLNQQLDKIFNKYQISQKSQTNNIITIFQCMSSKDIFLQSYQTYLSQRLLSATYNKIQAEKTFVQILKNKCGNQFTKNVQGKIFDYLTSLSDTKQFKHINATPFQFTIKILGKDYWTANPSQIQSQFIPHVIQFPKQLQLVKNKFQQYYINKHKKRHLEHLPLLSSVTILIKLNRKVNKYQKCEIIMSLFQASLIFYIQKFRDFVNYDQIAKVFPIQDRVLKSFLDSMASSNSNDQILIQKDQSYKFNDDFTTQYNRFSYRINRQQKRIRKQSINFQRDVAIQGAIVKIMKQKKKMQVYNLFESVDKYLKLFKPSISKLKQSIQKLIQKDYLERQEGQINILLYKD